MRVFILMGFVGWAAVSYRALEANRSRLVPMLPAATGAIALKKQVRPRYKGRHVFPQAFSISLRQKFAENVSTKRAD